MYMYGIWYHTIKVINCVDHKKRMLFQFFPSAQNQGRCNVVHYTIYTTHTTTGCTLQPYYILNRKFLLVIYAKWPLLIF